MTLLGRKDHKLFNSVKIFQTNKQTKKTTTTLKRKKTPSVKKKKSFLKIPYFTIHYIC